MKPVTWIITVLYNKYKLLKLMVLVTTTQSLPIEHWPLIGVFLSRDTTQGR